MSATSEVIAAALAMMTGGTAWSKGSGARDVNGLPVPPGSTRAVSWDLSSAIVLATATETDYTLRNEVFKTLTNAIPGSYKNRDIDSWNDSLDWADLQEAIGNL